MDWFERLTGFPEGSYDETRSRLTVSGGRLVGGERETGFSVGTLTLPSLAELRTQTRAIAGNGRLRLSIVEGDVRAMHGKPENRGALFQVASQFNMLEMVSPRVSPEDGITRYEHDRTQGPACAMAAGAATIFRNYLVPIDGSVGQTSDHQLDGLRDLGNALAQRTGLRRDELWTMQNGYALASGAGLSAIATLLAASSSASLNDLRGLLRVGLHQDVDATDVPAPGQQVSQIFCSALPVAYSSRPAAAWAPFARFVLEAAYEATFLAAICNAARNASNRVFLTRLGGGAFGNDDEWIDAAMQRAFDLARDHDLDVVIVSYGRPSTTLRSFVSRSGYAS